MKTIALTCGLLMMAGTAMADMTAQLSGGWDGRKVPPGQQCRLHGGNGSTPPMRAVWIVAYFNDKSYGPLSRNGGHGTIGFPVRGETTDLPSLPGMTATLPGGARVIKAARSSGDYASVGYLPPCSGGRGNRYTVDLKAIDKAGKVLDEITNFDIGRY
jgi:hypothetical protein